MKKMNEKPLSVMLVAVWFIILACLSLFVGALFLKAMWYFTLSAFQVQSAYEVSMSIGFLIFLSAPLFLITAIGLYQMKKWAFWLGLVLLLLTAPSIVSILCILVLVKNKEKFE